MDRKLSILIVDDEAVIRRGMKKAVESLDDHYEVVGLANDGETALELIHEQKVVPDVVITDIYMNFVDGIELIRELSSSHPAIKTIILSGHEEFQLAKQAIDLNVQSYLLKPVSINDLSAILLKMRSEIEANEQEQEDQATYLEMKKNVEPYVRDRLILDLLEGRLVSDEHLSLLAPFLPFTERDPVTIGTVRLINIESIKNPEHIMQTYAIKELLWKRMFKDREGFAVIKDSQTIYFGMTGEVTEDVRENLNRLTLEVEKNYQITIKYGIGSQAGSYEELPRAVGQSLDIIESETVDYYEYPFEDESELQLAFSVGNEEQIDFSLKEIMKKITRVNPSQEWTAQTLNELMYRLELILSEIGSPYPQIPFLGAYSKEEMLSRFEKWIRTCAEERKALSHQKTTSVLIEKVRMYLKEHYADQDLSLQKISDVAGVTPNYLTQEFRKVTGSSCMQYVTEIRMDKAKKLLRETDKKIYEIAERVGYDNPYYFSNAFKKNVGKNPSKYKSESSGYNEPF
ncbi:response regulator transcription factor [Salipaludibacillus aurantiacus]|uniref:Two-component response regulator, YesN/AraC family, consists of REC and AraC-type DNA-binding domains n=1 Tax=Salipaludibacillus aurantiacus TaxID=1601833 RepID=A0A1H9UQN0_9BACI|nr:response regulator [Salipaludibacillus aurantiacus]SES11658.1 Two-component response regulator, YesN/AraC family, consists of REC and AraC-type DNA-binding domains [Salipaludibacillus aurantiacus]